MSIAVNRATAVGVVRVRGGFIVSPYGAQREVWLVVEAGGKSRRDESCMASDLIFHLLQHHQSSFLLLLCHFHSAGGHTGFLLPQPLFLLARTTKRFSVLIFSADVRKSKFQEIPFLCCTQISSYQTVGIDLLGFDSLLRCDLLDVFLSFLQPMGEKKKKIHMDLIFADLFKARR